MIFCVFCAASGVAQKKQQRELPNSSPVFLHPFDLKLQLNGPSFNLPLIFTLTAPEMNMSLPLYQSFAGVPQSFAWDRPRSIDLTAPLKLQLYQSEPEKAIRFTLGAAELGGAAFLAYKYIKKNGLH